MSHTIYSGHDMIDTVARVSTATWAVSTGAAYTLPASELSSIAACIGIMAGVMACVSWALKIRKQWRER